MTEHLNFFLYNNVFERIVLILLITNFIFIHYLDILQSKSRIQAQANIDKIYQYKISIIFFVSISMIIYIVYKFKNFIWTLLLFILPLIMLIKSISSIYNNKNNFSLDNKYINVTSTIIFILFFSSSVTPVYLETFANILHIYREILLILYLIVKIILFTFLVFTNIFILFSNINAILKHKKSKTLSSYFIYKEKPFSFANYDFLLYRKFNTKLTRNIDIIIFLLLSIPTIIINIIINIYFYIIKAIKNKLFKFLKKLETEEKWNFIIKKLTNISIIIALIIVYIIMVLFKTEFSLNVIEIYTFLSTVILLPLIYDSIKSNK